MISREVIGDDVWLVGGLEGNFESVWQDIVFNLD